MTDDADRGSRVAALARFEQAVELPLMVLALAMVPLLVLPLVVDLSPAADGVLTAIDWFIWAAFAFEYVVRLTLTDQRARFVRREWPDLLIVVLPFLRPLRVVRSARALRLLRLTRVAAVLGEIHQEGLRLLKRHHLHYVLLVALSVVLVSGALVTVLEEGNGGSIHDFGDGLWWAMATITTVGYGDTYPTTDAGRGIAVALMVAGITLFGVLTANLAAFFVEHAEPDDDGDRIATKLDVLLERVAVLERKLDALKSTDTAL